jgi:hypothetical protein
MEVKMELIQRKDVKLRAFFLDIPGNHDLFGKFERMMRDNFVFDNPVELPLRIFRPVSKKKHGFNLVVSVLKIEIPKFYKLIENFCEQNKINLVLC